MHPITSVVRCKRADLLAKRLGSISGCDTKIIFLCMLRRRGSFSDQSIMHNVCQLRSKFNDVLNDNVAKNEHHIMTINSCDSYEHFDRAGKLSIKGKRAFWREIDDLIQRFEENRIKLLPNPKNPLARQYQQDRSYNRMLTSDNNRVNPRQEQFEEYFTADHRERQ